MFQICGTARIWRDINVSINDVSVDLPGDHRFLLAGLTMGAREDARDQGDLLIGAKSCRPTCFEP
jgi:hypothetical protein